MSDIKPEILVFNQYPTHYVSTKETPLSTTPCLQSTLPLQQNTDKTQQDDNEQDGVPLTAAGLTRAMETNQGQPLTEIINISTANPSHLFWVPASQHPELAPAEFEKYVTALRTTAIDKGKVRRRRSVLSVSFTPGEDGDLLMTTNDDDELKRSNNQEENDNDNNSTKDGERLSALEALENKKEQQHYETSLLLVRSNSMKSLGEMNDMDQPLFNQSSGQLESNTQDQDNNKLETKARKDRLRRSMSLQLPGNNTDPGRIPDFLVFDRNSTTLDQSPVLVPRTNRPLSRRGARTKFQRTSSISPSSMQLGSRSPPEQRWPAYRHSDSIYTSSSPSPTVNETSQGNQLGLDSNGQDHQAEQPYQHHNLSDSALLFDGPDIDLDLTLPSSMAMKFMQPTTTGDQQLVNNGGGSPDDYCVDGTSNHIDSASSYDTMVTSMDNTISPPRLESPHPPAATKPSPRERKSSWSWSFWSDDKKAKSDQPPLSSSHTSVVKTEAQGEYSNDTTPPQPTTSSSTPTSKQRFGFSSLFTRKSSTSNNANTSTITSSSSDTNKKTPATIMNGDGSTNMPMPPKDFQLNKINHHRRLPIHIERAVYRLSHAKLANPRRPLHEQVIISNFMFWYLTIISQHQTTSTSSIPSQQESGSSPRPTPPRTPQQIVAASKKKKKRLTKKNSQPMHQRQPSHTLSTASSNQRNQSLPATHHMQDKSSWQHYIDGSSKQSSTGFVIPENYLRPSSESNLGDSSTDSDYTKHNKRQNRHYARRNSSSSEDDDDDDDDSDMDDDDDDDEEDYRYKTKNNSSQRRTKQANHAFDQQHKKQPQQHYTPVSSSVPILSSQQNSVPLVIYKKATMS